MSFTFVELSIFTFIKINFQAGHEPRLRVWELYDVKGQFAFTQIVDIKHHQLGISCVVSFSSSLFFIFSQILRFFDFIVENVQFLVKNKFLGYNQVLNSSKINQFLALYAKWILSVSRKST